MLLASMQGLARMKTSSRFCQKVKNNLFLIVFEIRSDKSWQQWPNSYHGRIIETNIKVKQALLPANLYMNLSSVQSFESILVSVYYFTKYNLSCGDHTRRNAVCCDDHPLQNGLSRDWNWKLIILVSKQHKYIHCCNPSHGLFHGKKKEKNK